MGFFSKRIIKRNLGSANPAPINFSGLTTLPPQPDGSSSPFAKRIGALIQQMGQPQGDPATGFTGAPPQNGFLSRAIGPTLADLRSRGFFEPNTTQGAMGGSSQEATGGSAPMSNPFMGGSPIGFSIDQSMIDRVREMIRQRQQQMAQPAPQQPQMDPAAIQARLDEFLANNPDRASISLPFGGNIDIANLRDRMARLSALMGRGMTAQEAMGNQRAAIAQGHDLNNDGIVTDAEYRQSTMPAPTGEMMTSRTPVNPSAVNAMMMAGGGRR